MYSMSRDDLMRLYAKLNAQDHLITVCLAALKSLVPDPEFFDALKMSAMALADRQQLNPDEPNPEFGKDTQVLTLRMVMEAFEKASGPAEGESSQA
jgi:hypothetical protein